MKTSLNFKDYQQYIALQAGIPGCFKLKKDNYGRNIQIQLWPLEYP
jgi:hypothetical protein